jgi:hypothetical protein
MDFNEHPLTYRDAVTYMRAFEAQYQTRSDDYFRALAKGEGRIEIDPDDLYEWRSYFEFVTLIDSKLETAISENPIEDGGLPFSSSGGDAEPKEQNPAERANNNLALAA